MGMQAEARMAAMGLALAGKREKGTTKAYAGTKGTKTMGNHEGIRLHEGHEDDREPRRHRLRRRGRRRGGAMKAWACTKGTKSRGNNGEHPVGRRARRRMGNHEGFRLHEGHEDDGEPRS